MVDHNTVFAIGIGNGRSHITALYSHLNRYVVQCRRTISQPYRAADRGTITVVQRNILRMGRGGCRDVLGSAGFVASARWVAGGKGKGASMGNAKGVAAVGGGVNPGSQSGTGPHQGILSIGN